jgi:hypothetical protein
MCISFVWVFGVAQGRAEPVDTPSYRFDGGKAQEVILQERA